MAQPTFRTAETTIKKGNEHIPLSILSLNAQGLYSKFALFQAMIEEHDPDIIAVTETWLDASISDSEFTPQGYVTFRKDRNIDYYAANIYRNENRGGVLMMVKSELNATRYTRAEVNAEIMWIQINPYPKAEWLYGVCYRPEVDEEEMLSRIDQSINQIDIENTVLLDDFNFRRRNLHQNNRTKLHWHHKRQPPDPDSHRTHERWQHPRPCNCCRPLSSTQVLLNNFTPWIQWPQDHQNRNETARPKNLQRTKKNLPILQRKQRSHEQLLPRHRMG